MLTPVLRAGMALLPAFMEAVPDALVGVVGVERDEETALPNLYCNKLPTEPTRIGVILDPMLATGGTACMTAKLILATGVEPDKIYFTGALAAPLGLERLSEMIPRRNIVLAGVDDGLDERMFIIPGIGDYGDRYYGTL